MTPGEHEISRRVSQLLGVRGSGHPYCATDTTAPLRPIFDIGQQRSRAFRDPVLALEARHRLVEARDINGLGDLRQCHDIWPAAHDRGEIVHAISIQRIDADCDDCARLAPRGIEISRQCAR